jgi:glycosyltransferase involved in cell wall biosynthesis
MDLSIIVPIYNEQESITKLYQALVPVLVKLKKQSEIIFIDDGSTDKSFEIMNELASRDRTLKIIKFSRNFGQTAALLAGFEHAQGKVLVTLDADLQNNPDDIPKLLNKLGEGYDVVCGWRFDRHDSIGKRLASKLSNLLRRRLIKLDIHDSGCTLRVYKREAVKGLHIYGESHRFIPVIMSSRGFKVGEEKVSHSERKFGKTKYGVARLPKGFIDLLTLKFLMKYGRRPAHIFGSLGMVLLFFGFLGGLYMLYEKFALGYALAGRPAVILVALLLILGVQFIMNGLIAEMVVRTQHKQSYNIEKTVNK